MNEDDLRVQRTRNLLQKALIELMASKDYEEISVRDLTTRAQVGYRTFFHHYECKDELLQTIIDSALAEFLQVRIAPGADEVPLQNTLSALHYAQEHADLFRLLLRTSAAEKLVVMATDFGMVEGKSFFSGSGLPDDLVAYHFASSVISLMRWWLEHDMPYPPEEMAEYINQLLILPIRQLPTGG